MFWIAKVPCMPPTAIVRGGNVNYAFKGWSLASSGWG